MSEEKVSPRRKKELRVTLIMPALNEEGTAKETLDSVFGQSRLPDEIVVADGCSTDGTVSVVESYRGRGVPLEVVKNEKVVVPAGRNLAIERASYEVIAAADFGTILDRRWLEELVGPLERDPSVDAVAGTTRPRVSTRFEKTVAAVVYGSRFDPDRLTPEELAQIIPEKILFSGNSVAFRKEVWRRAGGFPEWILWGEDRFFARKLHHIGARVVGAVGAVAHTELRSTLTGLFRQFYFYSKGNAQTGWISTNVYRLGLRYLFLVLLLAGGFFYTALWYLSALGLTARIYRSGVKRYRDVHRKFPDWRSLLWIPVILFAHDAAVLAGHLSGVCDWWVDPFYRRRARAYVAEEPGNEAAVEGDSSPRHGKPRVRRA